MTVAWIADCWMENPDENMNDILEFVQKQFAPGF